MKTTFSLLVLVIAVLLAAGCSGVQNTPAVTTAPPATVAVTQPNSTAVLIHNTLSIKLDPVLGSGYGSLTIAESAGTDKPYFDIYPEYNELTIQNYKLPGTTQEARIYLFPVLRYRELSPELMPAREADLQSLLTGGPSGSKELPFLPIFNSLQMFTAQVDVIQFQNGKGIRYITQYSQGIVPINNQEMFYTFQGLTADNQYWVAAILPISSSILPADGQNPPNGQSMEDFALNYKKYIADTTAQLNAQSPNSFVPAIPMLDALVNSIIIQP